MDQEVILIVDDDKDVRTVFSKAMKGKYKVIEAANGKDALDKLSKNPINIIVLDIILPDMNGLHLLKYIKTFYPKIPVLIVTGFGSEQLAAEALRLGARDYFSKPYSIKEIAEKIEVILRYIREFKEREREGERRKSRRDFLISCIERSMPISKEVRIDMLEEFNPHIKKAMKYIEKNFNKKNLKLKNVAKEACLSQYHFSRIFKEISGMTYTEYLNKVKIRKAKKILRDETKSILDIALMVGYNSLSHFNRVFKKYEGISPKEYRKGLY